MELTFFGDCVNLLAKVTRHLEDGQIFKLLNFCHTWNLLGTLNPLGTWNMEPGTNFYIVKLKILKHYAKKFESLR